MLTLEETLEQQKDLDKICCDRSLQTRELFSGNAFYGNNKIIKLFAELPIDYPLKMNIEHGVGYNDSFVWLEEIQSILPILTYKSKERKIAYEKAFSKYKKEKILLPIASPILYLSQLLGENNKQERKGTIFFSAHSTHHVTAETDWEALALELRELDEKYHPITVCIYWKDYLLGRHIPFQKRGFKVVSAGHMFDPNFLFRFYHLCSLHYYSASNELGSNLFYSVEAGCSYFYWDNIEYTYHAENEEILKRDTIKYDTNEKYWETINKIKNLFKTPRESLSLEQLDLVDYFLGKQYFLSPEQLRQQILDADLIFSQMAQKHFFLLSSLNNQKKENMPQKPIINNNHSNRQQHLSPPLPKGDYVSPNLKIIKPDQHFPNMIIGNTDTCLWPYLRREIPHNWYVDKRQPTIGFLSRDEASILYNNALQFSGKQALEIGCWMGWSACHLALAGLKLDVIDPVLSNEQILNSVHSSLLSAGVINQVNLIPGYSPQMVSEIANKYQRKWSLIFIDGNHESPGPLNDAIVCEPYAEDDAMILFHDLASPDVAQGLDYFKSKGWNTMVYQTMQIMGVAWRGNVKPILHQPDLSVSWTLPEHLRTYQVSGISNSQNKKNILFITTDPGVGGVAQYNHSLVCYLAQQNYDVTYLQPKGFQGQDLIREQELNVKHQWFTINQPLNLNFLELQRPDLIICSNSNVFSNFQVKQKAIQLEIPYIVVEGLVEPHLADNFSEYLSELKFHYEQAKAVIAVCQDNLQLLRQLFGLPSDKGQVIHYGRAESYFEPINESVRLRLRQQLNIPEDGVVCFTTARIENRKGYQYQMEAIKQLMHSSTWNQLYFVWAGGGIFQPQLEEELRKTVQELDIDNQVLFLGQTNDIDNWLNIADIFVFPSELEGMPLSVMEAMAKGIPVIASAVSGIPEELGDTGKLITDPKINAKATIKELVETIQEWSLNPLLLKKIGHTCKRRAEKMFTESRMLSETLAVIVRSLNNSLRHPVVIIDGVFFQLYKTGIARVWKSLLEQWANTDFANHILVLDRANTAPKINGIRYRTIHPYDYNNTEGDRTLLQQICDEEEAELFISSYYTTPINTPSVFMAYDMIPEIIGRNLNDPMWIEKHKGINHASAFIAISHNTAKDINKIFPQIPVESITVAHCGVDEKFIPATPEEIRNFKHKYGINKPYFLLGNLGVNGYKNAILFFQAFAQLANKTSFDIVATGAGSQLPNEWRQYTEGCTFHSLYLSDEELRLAYGGAVAFVFPSKYEGFGMPVAEAMACGCPVITTPNSSLPEVGGEAVIYVKDDDIEAMANALCDVQKPSLRRNLIQAGLQQAQKFSWTTMAEIVKETLFNAISPQIKLTDTNYLIFPDWQSDEETLTEELYNLIHKLAILPSPSGRGTGGEGIITLVINTTGITEEDANLFLSAIAMNLMMEEELDLENTLDFALINNLNEQQWNNLLPKITAKITLENENQKAIKQINLEDLVTINDNGNNYAIFPDWKADQEELALEIGQVLMNLSEEENSTLLVNLNNADREEVGLFFSEIAMNLMLSEGVELSDNLQINFVNFTVNQWQSLGGLIKEKITINQEDLPDNLFTEN